MINSFEVLRVLCRTPVASRAELAELTSLSPATISRAVARLRGEGLVSELTLPSNGVGRPPRVVQLRADAASVLGIDAGGSHIRVVLADLEGRMQARAARTLRSMRRRESMVTSIVRLAREVAERAPQRVVAATVGISGIVNPDSGRVMFSPDLPALEGAPVADLLADAFGMPVAIDNDDLLAAVGEATFGAATGCANVVFLSLGHGIGAGLLVDGRPVRGARSAAGAIAYFAPGRLEDRASGRAIPRLYLERRAIRSEVNTGISAERVFQLAGQGDNVARTVVDEALGALGDAVVDVSALLDPQVVVVGGGLVRGQSGFVERLQELVAAALPFPPRVVESELGEDAVARGAVSSAIGLAQRALADGVAGDNASMHLPA